MVERRRVDLSKNGNGKNVGGRPTKYKSAHCDKVIESGKLGHSLTAFAGKVGVCYDTVNEWTKRYPAFAEAVKVATAGATLVWEEKLIALANTGKGNATAVIFGLKNRASDDWKDRVVKEITGKDQGPVSIEITPETARALPDDQLERLEALLRLVATGEPLTTIPDDPKRLH